MSGIYYFTSVTANYIPKARIVARTLKQYDDRPFILALCDNIPENFDLATEPFDEIILTDKLSQIDDPQAFFFRHNVTEVCTAVKPYVALEIMDRYHTEKVCYLDPDIAVFSKLEELDGLLDRYSMIFTPHTTVPEEKHYFIRGNEALFLKRGTNNLGFFAVKGDNEGRRFLKWWAERLANFCLDDDYTILPLLDEQGLLGLFTDQKWIDMVPSFFDNYLIYKHPGYNVSTWNLSNRVISGIGAKEETLKVNGEPLRFFHFSGVDSGAHMSVMQSLASEYSHVKSVLKLSKWYIDEENSAGQTELEKIEWKYARYDDGTLIHKTHRKVMQCRKDIIDVFPNPFEKHDGRCYYTWMMGEYGELLAGAVMVRHTPPQPKGIFAFGKRILLLFVKPDSRLYMGLKRIWRALKIKQGKKQ